MKVYELMAALAEVPGGAEVMCNGIETLDSIVSAGEIGRDENGNKEYPISREIVEVDVEDKRVFLTW